MHSYEVKLKGWQQASIGKIQNAYEEHEEQGLSEDQCKDFNDKNPYGFPIDECDRRDVYRAKVDINTDEPKEEPNSIDLEGKNIEREVVSSESRAGAIWDVFRREDIPKLAEYLRSCSNEFLKSDAVLDDHVSSGFPLIYYTFLCAFC